MNENRPAAYECEEDCIPMPSEEERPLFVPCETCRTEGRMFVGSYEDEREIGPCPACRGTCAMEVPSESVALDDLS